MNIDLSNPPYAVKLNDLGFAYSHTDREKGIIVSQSKPLGTVSTNWNAPELAEYAIPRMNNTLLLHGHTHAYDPLEFGRHHNEINVGLDAWCFEPVNEAELVDNWLHTASSAV